MSTYNNLPLYVMAMDDQTEEVVALDAVAFVGRPAIRRGWLAFREDAPAQMAFAVTSEERRIVSGPAMLADTPIYRKDETDEYYVTFPAAAIERLVQKFFAQGRQASVNEMHDPARKVEGVVMFESFISDPARGVAPMKGHEDAPPGSWFVSFRVDNDEVWKSIKDGTFTGFSVEGLFAWKAAAPAVPWHNPALEMSAEEVGELDALHEFLKNL